MPRGQILKYGRNKFQNTGAVAVQNGKNTLPRFQNKAALEQYPFWVCFSREKPSHYSPPSPLEFVS